MTVYVETQMEKQKLPLNTKIPQKKEAEKACDSWDVSYKINDGSCSL